MSFLACVCAHARSRCKRDRRPWRPAGRCRTRHGIAHRLAVVAADPLATLTAAVTTTDLVALCAACQTGAHRAATKAADATVDTAQPDLFDTTGSEAA